MTLTKLAVHFETHICRHRYPISWYYYLIYKYFHCSEHLFGHRYFWSCFLRIRQYWSIQDLYIFTFASMLMFSLFEKMFRNTPEMLLILIIFSLNESYLLKIFPIYWQLTSSRLFRHYSAFQFVNSIFIIVIFFWSNKIALFFCGSRNSFLFSIRGCLMFISPS